MPHPCIISGNVGSEPELRFTPNGKAVCNLSIALNAGKDKDGEKTTVWVKVAVWNELAETVNKGVKMGQRVEVRGILTKPDVYESKKHPGEYSANINMTGFWVGIMPNEIQYKELVTAGKESKKNKEEDLPF